MNTNSDRTVRIIGVPLDLGASRRGTDMGPSAMRIAGLGNALRRMGYTVAREEDIPAPAMETGTPEDLKARFKPQILEVCSHLADRVVSILDDSDFPLVLGGDHSIAMGTFAGTASHYRDRGESVGLLWFDAHGDMNIPGVSPSGNIHGMAAVSRRALEVVNDGTAGFHISFDVDGCDPTVIPGSGTLVPGGVSFREAHLLMEYCADDGNLLSMEIVELNPFLDEGNVSAERAMELLLSAMGKSIL